jgi:hypothetical protein
MKKTGSGADYRTGKTLGSPRWRESSPRGGRGKVFWKIPKFPLGFLLTNRYND